MSYFATKDRSAPRSAVRNGDLSKDARGRVCAMPPILHYGFRPFFFLAALHAGLAIPLWLGVYLGGFGIGGPFDGMHWHAHEMLFGYLGAVIAGFILTAIPNWTGRFPLSGWPLAAFVGLWLAGRVACLLSLDPWLAMAVDMAFPATLAFVVWREVIAGKNWKNAPVAVMIALFACASGVDHLAGARLLDHDLGQRLALAVAAMLIALIGGRIVPSFTRNWLVKQADRSLPASVDALDKAALATTGAAMTGWLVVPETTLVGVLLCAAGSLLAARLYRWRGLATFGEPILFVLHIGYGWLSAALVLLGLAMLWPETVPQTAALHALTAGAIGTMTLGVMTRASLGHTGRAIIADRFVIAMYGMVSAGSLLRVVAPFFDQGYLPVLASGGALWAGAFLFFAVRYAPILWTRRAGA